LRKSKFAPEQIVQAIQQVDVGTVFGNVCRKLGVTEATFYREADALHPRATAQVINPILYHKAIDVTRHIPYHVVINTTTCLEGKGSTIVPQIDHRDLRLRIIYLVFPFGECQYT